MATSRFAIPFALGVALTLAVAAGGAASTRPGTIVFSAHPSGDATPQLFRVRVNGEGLTQITTGAQSATAPSVSPDGRRVAFMRLGSGIYVANMDGTGLRRLTQGVRDSYPVWSPNGGRIAFLRPVHAQWRLFVGPATRGKPRRLAQAPPVGRPSWSRDGTSIFAPSAGDLVKLDAQTGKVQKYYGMTIDIQTGQTATVSPGARMVAFVGPRVSTGPEDCGESPCPQFGLYLENVSKPHRLRRVVNDTGPAGWSPDGTQLVFVSRGALTLMDVQTTAKILLPVGAHVPTGDAPPAWIS
jgi:dipeptidyl aminopeptidase/acylaminoacyl peptidase